MAGLQETIEKHSWRFNSESDEEDENLETLHADLIAFLNRNLKRIESVELKYGRKFHLPYFTKIPKHDGRQNNISE